MNYVGLIGALFLAGYLLVVGITALIGTTAIPAWFVGILAVAAGILILIGAFAGKPPP